MNNNKLHPLLLILLVVGQICPRETGLPVKSGEATGFSGTVEEGSEGSRDQPTE